MVRDPSREDEVRIADFQALTFDCYGTLVDWESGIATHLEAWLVGHGRAAGAEELLGAFADAEARIEQENPTTPYNEVLRIVHADLARRFQIQSSPVEAERFAVSIANWPPFPDTVAALRILKERYRLVIVSNVDRCSFTETAKRLGVDFDVVITAEEVGAYKPDHCMFQRAFDRLKELGVERSGILHVAQSLYHDHLPAKALGLTSIWVDRRQGRSGWGATPPSSAPVKPDLVVGSLAELVALDDRQRVERRLR